MPRLMLPPLVVWLACGCAAVAAAASSMSPVALPRLTRSGVDTIGARGSAAGTGWGSARLPRVRSGRSRRWSPAVTLIASPRRRRSPTRTGMAAERLTGLDPAHLLGVPLSLLRIRSPRVVRGVRIWRRLCRGIPRATAGVWLRDRPRWAHGPTRSFRSRTRRSSHLRSIHGLGARGCHRWSWHAVGAVEGLAGTCARRRRT